MGLKESYKIEIVVPEDKNLYIMRYTESVSRILINRIPAASVPILIDEILSSTKGGIQNESCSNLHKKK